jgi:hypothetical protein
MRSADHLGEIDDNRVTVVVADKDVEFVKIAVNESCLSKSNDEVHKCRIEFARGRYFGDLASEGHVSDGGENEIFFFSYKGYASMYSMRMQCLE